MKNFNHSGGEGRKEWKLILPNSVIWYHAYILSSEQDKCMLQSASVAFSRMSAL